MPVFIVNVHLIFREGAPCKIKHLISGQAVDADRRTISGKRIGEPHMT